jgi:hypothetical protein
LTSTRINPIFQGQDSQQEQLSTGTADELDDFWDLKDQQADPVFNGQTGASF